MRVAPGTTWRAVNTRSPLITTPDPNSVPSQPDAMMRTEGTTGNDPSTAVDGRSAVSESPIATAGSAVARSRHWARANTPTTTKSTSRSSRRLRARARARSLILAAVNTLTLVPHHDVSVSINQFKSSLASGPDNALTSGPLDPP